MIVTAKYLREHPDCIFVFGDNNLHKGCKGAAALRYEKNAYGFITKKVPSFADSSYYKPYEYKDIFERELNELIRFIETYPLITFLISKLGAGLANKYNIWEEVIKPGLEPLRVYKNVTFLWEQ